MFRAFLTTGLLLGACASVLRGEQTTEESPKINFTDHVLPIFRQHCLKCHNANDAEAGLAIDSYAGLLEGGGSGEAVSAGDASGSRLYQVMSHAEEPFMPPNQEPLPSEKLAIIEQWIDGGLLESSGSKVRTKKGPSLAFTSIDAGGKPSEIPMPQSLWRVPVVTSERAAAASAIATSPWAPLVAIGGQKQVVMYNTDTSDLVGIIPYPDGVPQALQFSLDGGYLLVAGGTHAAKGIASLYDVKTGDRLLSVGDELDTVFGADVNDSLSRIALGGPQRIVRVFDTATGKQRFELKKHTDWVYCVDYSPDGVLIASGDRSGGLHVWEADTGRLYLDLIGHTAAIRGLSWRADSNVLVSASEDGTIKLWEMNGGKQLKSISAHGGGATGVMMAKDGRIVSCGKDKTVKLWKPDGSAIATFPAFTEAALEAAITYDGSKVIGGDWNGRTVMWATADPKQASELAANPPRLEDQRAALANRVAELDKAMQSAAANQASQQKALENFTSAHAGLVEKLAETQSLLAKSKVEKTAAEKLLNELTEQKRAEEEKLKAVQAQVAALEKKIKDSSAEMQIQQQRSAAASMRRDAATKDRASVVAALEKSKAEHDQLKTETVTSLTSITGRELDAAAHERVATAIEADAEAALSAAKATLDALNQQLVAADATAKELALQLDAAKGELSLAADAIAALPAKIDAASKQLDTKSAEANRLQKEISDASEETQKNALSKMLASVQAELNAARTAKSDLEKQFAEANARKAIQDKLVHELTGKVATTSQAQKDLQVKLDSAQKQLVAASTKREVAAKDKQAIVQQLAKISGEIAAVTKLKQDAVEQLASAVRQQSQLIVREQELSSGVAQEEAARVAAEASVADHKKMIEATKQTLLASQAEQQKVSEKLGELATKLKAQPGAVAQCDAQIQRHTAAIPQFQAQMVDTKKKMDESNAALVASKGATDAARQSRDAAKAKLQGIETELVAFRTHAEKLAEEYRLIAAAADEKQKSVEKEIAEAAKIAASMAVHDEQLKQVTESLAKLQAQLAELQKTQAAEKQSLDAAKAKLSELEAAAEAADAEAEEKRERAEFFQSAYGA